MKTYLQPQIMRRGAEALLFVTKEPVQKGLRKARQENVNYWVGIYTGRGAGRKGSYQGIDKEYNHSERSRISKEFYQAFIKEAKRLHVRYRVPKQ